MWTWALMLILVSGFSALLLMIIIFIWCRKFVICVQSGCIAWSLTVMKLYIKKILYLFNNFLTIHQISCQINGTFLYSTQSQETLYLFGEKTSNGISNSLISIDLSALQSEVLSPEFIYPRAIAYHSLVRCRKDLWLYGGCSYNEL